MTVTHNRVVGGANGVSLGGGVMQGNLVANNSGIGLQINGNSTVISNTFTGNTGSTIKLISATSLLVNGNNLEGNLEIYDIENLIPQTNLMMVQAMYNWWGTVNNSEITPVFGIIPMITTWVRYYMRQKEQPRFKQHRLMCAR